MSINSYIAAQFSNPKGVGGSIVSFVMNRQNRPLYDETIGLLAAADSDSILDIGCGNGYVLNLLARRSKGMFAGIDPSKNIIEAALRRNHKYVRKSQMNFSCQDVSAMAFPDAFFSKAYTINTVYFWNDIEDAMKEIHRVLKADGIFINTLYTNESLSRFPHTRFGYKRYAPEQLIKAGVNAGFSVKAVPVLQETVICYVYQKRAEGQA